MYRTHAELLQLAVIVIAWSLGLNVLPLILGTCLDGVCGFTAVEIVFSVIVPLIFVAVPVMLEMLLYGQPFETALRDLGLTRLSFKGVGLALLYLVPLMLFYPIFAVLAQTQFLLAAGWHWRVLSAILINGLAEEIMLRGFVFRRLREGRTFWQAAGLSTVYFAGSQLFFILTAGAVGGIIAFAVAIPLGFLMAYVYERGDNSLIGPILLRVISNSLAFVFVFPGDLQPLATTLYLLVGVIVAVIILVWAYSGGYGQQKKQPGPTAI